MPVDHRRINGPEDTVPYHLFSKLNIQSLSSKFADVYKNGKRKDDRKSNEHRKMCKYKLTYYLNNYYVCNILQLLMWELFPKLKDQLM